MRFFWFIILVVFVGAVSIFAWQNASDVVLHFFDWQITASLALLIAAVYLLGMLSGWTVLGVVRRSLDRIGER